MDRLSSEDVKRSAGFLDFKDMVNLSQTQQPFQADLRPLIRKAEVDMLKENVKLKKVVTSMTRALIHIDSGARDDEVDVYVCRHVVMDISDMLRRKFGEMFELDTRRKLHETWNSFRMGPPPLAYFDGPTEDDEAIIQHFLNEMD